MNRSEVATVIAKVFADSVLQHGPLPAVVDCYLGIANRVSRQQAEDPGKSLIIGLCGPQGSGKSTMAKVLEALLRELHSFSVAILSLDDLYLPREARGRLALEVHPLLITRGVPGTHDPARGIEVIKRLAAATPEMMTRLPRFDKEFDEPRAEARQPIFVGRPHIVILEGWCVGAAPEAATALAEPVNELERVSDPDGRWRRYVNEQLAGRYQELFALIDLLIMLRSQNFEQIVSWRQEQEHQLAARLSLHYVDRDKLRIMNDDQVQEFVMLFERLTRHIAAEMPSRADIVVEIGASREIVKA